MKKSLLDVEVLSKDKIEALNELDVLKEKEEKITYLWEEKLGRVQTTNYNKILEIQDLKDREFLEKAKRFEEKIRLLDNELVRAEEVNGSKLTKECNCLKI